MDASPDVFFIGMGTIFAFLGLEKNKYFSMGSTLKRRHSSL